MFCNTNIKKYYEVLLLLLASVFFLDFTFRYSHIIIYLSNWQLIKAGAAMFLTLPALALAGGIVLGLVEDQLQKISPPKFVRFYKLCIKLIFVLFFLVAFLGLSSILFNKTFTLELPYFFKISLSLIIVALFFGVLITTKLPKLDTFIRSYLLLAIICGGIFLCGLREVFPLKQSFPVQGQKYHNIIIITNDNWDARRLFWGKRSDKLTNLNDFYSKSYVFYNAKSVNRSTNLCMPAILKSQPKAPSPAKKLDPETLSRVLEQKGFSNSFHTLRSHYQLFLRKCGFWESFNKTVPDLKWWRLSGHLDNFFASLGFYTWFSSIEDKYYIEKFTEGKDRCVYGHLVDRSALHSLHLGLEQIRAARKSRRPFFFWAHITSFHEYNVYLPPVLKSGEDQYDQILELFDLEFGRFIKAAEKEACYNNSIIVLAADHGNISRNIPIIIHVPGQKKGKKIFSRVNQIDIAPTILELNNIPIPKWMEGKSLVKYWGR